MELFLGKGPDFEIEWHSSNNELLVELVLYETSPVTKVFLDTVNMVLGSSVNGLSGEVSSSWVMNMLGFFITFFHRKNVIIMLVMM